MKFLLACSFLLLLAACGSGQAGSLVEEATPVLDGATLFKAKGCVACHTLGGGVKVGPDLKGLFSRREEAWVRRYLADPVTMTAEDPIARQLKAQFRIQMPRLALSPQELEGLMTYLRESSR
ncbi:MAG TPA: hypothetical protein DF383_06935 [Deltaproteobacteria bacterium]|nr:hypothetical protein [Deltaproteobacteria bacterium]